MEIDNKTREEKFDAVNAIHEAGHAVMTLALGGIVEHAYLGDPFASIAFGGVSRRYGHGETMSATEFNILVKLSGMGAEVLYRDCTWSLLTDSSGRGDWKLVQEELTSIAAYRHVHKRVVVAEFKKNVTTILTEHWAAVLAVSAELLKHRYLTGKQIQDIWEELQPSSRVLIMHLAG